MGLYDRFSTDAALETGGIDLDFGSDGTITIARAGGANKKFGRVFSELMKPHRRDIDSGTLDDATADAILIEAYSRTIVLGWEGVTGRDGQSLPFTVENCVTLLTDLPELFGEIRTQAQRLANFQSAGREADAKN